MSRLKGFITAFLTTLLLILAGQRTAAAPDGWDKALDQYEAICQRCLELKARALQGEAIPADTVRDLLAELANLRKTLQSGSGVMSEEQRARFERIRQAYQPTAPEGRSANPILPENELIPLSQIASTPESLPPIPVTESSERIRRWQWGFAAVAGIPIRKDLTADDGSAGLMLMALDRKSGFGAYLKGISTFHYKSVGGTCFRDGTLPDDGFFYASGNTGYSAFAVTGGILYRFHRNVGIWAGIGYAAETVYWEHADGAWYGVKDASGGGICPEAGLMLTLGNFRCGSLTILAGGRFPLAKKASVDVGLGWLF